MQYLFVGCKIMLLFVLIAVSSFGSVPPMMSYQGKLLESGSPVPDGMHAMTFSLFTQETGGTAVWTEAKSVQVSGGLFSILLGSVNALPESAFQGNTWLETQVDGNFLIPRIQIVSVGYAIRAGIAENVPEGSITGNQIVNGSISAGDLAVPFVLIGADTGAIISGTNTGGGSQAIGTNSVSVSDLDTGGWYGVLGKNELTGNWGVLGTSQYGTYGYNEVSDNRGALGTPLYGVYGVNYASSNMGSLGTEKEGVYGANDNGNEGSLGRMFEGVYGKDRNGNSGALGTMSNGAYGYNNESKNHGSLGTSTEGVSGENNNGNKGALGTSIEGAYGRNVNGNLGQLGLESYAVLGENYEGHRGGLASLNEGVWGRNANGNNGSLGTSSEGAFGRNDNFNSGALGTLNEGVYGRYGIDGPWGALGSSTVGVFGQLPADGPFGALGVTIAGVNYGVYAAGNLGTDFTRAYMAGPTNAVEGRNPSGAYGVLGGPISGAYGESTGAASWGRLGSPDAGASGWNLTGNWGALGRPTEGVVGENPLAGTRGLLATEHAGVAGYAGTGTMETYAGSFVGDVGVTEDLQVNGVISSTSLISSLSMDTGWLTADSIYAGSIYTETKYFRIDHPLAPSDKYLVHSCLESSEMMNVYSGNVTTNMECEAVVILPDYFEALNCDFRYQLTVIGEFAQAIIAQEIRNNSFTIKTDKPKVKVSWQVSGVRQDAYAKAHPMQVVQEKAENEQGRYLHPELYGKSDSLRLQSAYLQEQLPRQNMMR